jgi:hypothetical protein
MEAVDLVEAYSQVYQDQELGEANKLEKYRNATERQRVGRRQSRDFENILHPADWDTQGEPVRKKIHADKRGVKKNTNRESYDLYDIILSHLLDEGYAETSEAAEQMMVNMSEGWRDSILQELWRGRHGQSETDYMNSRSQGGKMISGDSKHSGAAYSHRSYKGVGSPAKPGEHQPNQGRMDSGTRTDLQYRKALLKKK